MNGYLLLATQDGFSAWEKDNDRWDCIERGLEENYLTCITAHGPRILAGSHAGVWRSENLGGSWQESSEGLSLPHCRWLTTHPEEPERILLGTEPAGIFLSREGGRSWNERPEVAEFREEGGWYLPYSPEAGCVRGFACHGSRLYAAVEQGGVLVSDDTGENWRIAAGSTGGTDTPAPEDYIHPDVHSVAVHPSSPDLVFAPCGGGFYRSPDGGDAWDDLYECYCRAVWVDPEDPQVMILGPADGVSENGRIEITRDAGRSWEPAWDGMDCPWPEHMVERFLSTEEELLAVLSNGELIAADPQQLTWRRILPEESTVEAAVWISG